MQCPKCDAALPNDARFCIECGASINQAATGPTQRIGRQDERYCPTCHTANPAEAVFCVTCGRALSKQPTQPAPTPLSLGSLETPQPPATTASAAPPKPTPDMADGSRKQWGAFGTNMDSIAAGVFMIGLAVLFLTKSWWPGIMIVIGLSGAISSIGRGARTDAFQTLFWMIGIAILIATGWWWPGILILIGVSAFMGGTSCRKC